MILHVLCQVDVEETILTTQVVLRPPSQIVATGQELRILLELNKLLGRLERPLPRVLASPHYLCPQSPFRMRRPQQRQRLAPFAPGVQHALISQNHMTWR